MPYIAISIVALAIIAGVVIFIGDKRIRDIDKGTIKENKPMFWVGIAVVAVAVIFFITAKGEFENKIWAIPIWIVGIGLIANSRYRFIK